MLRQTPDTPICTLEQPHCAGRSPWFLEFLPISSLLLISGRTVVPIDKVDAKAASETFDPVAFVVGVWVDQVRPANSENAEDLPNPRPITVHFSRSLP